MLAAVEQAKEAQQVPAVALVDFVEKCLIVEKETGALIAFSLWPLQREALAVIEREDKLIVPKGRQVGVTHLELAAMLWAGTQQGHRLFPIARQSQEYAQDAITRLVLLAGYDPSSNPPNMRVLTESPMPAAWRPEIIAKTAMSLTLANGSHYRALTATQQIGRGLAAYWGLADEASFWPWLPQQIAALESGCARLHIVSTGNGEGGYFYDLYQKAVAGQGEYVPLFIPSTADPRRDRSWYVRNVEQAADPEGAAREHARRVEDAFRSPEGAYFKKFSRESNVREFDVVRGWRTDTAIDWGLNHPAALFLQVSPTGQPFVFDEYMPTDEPKTTEFGHAVRAKLVAYNVNDNPHGPYADPAGANRNSQTKRSEFQVFRELSFSPVGITSKVNDGCVYMRESIGAEPGVPIDETSERLIVHPRCLGLIAALTNVKPHRNDPDVYDTDHEIYSHPLDALRYWHVNRYQRRKKAGTGSVGGVPQGRDRSGF